jgi:hypothetical protein
MHRRDFLKLAAGSAAATLAVAKAKAAEPTPSGAAREYYEYRIYKLAAGVSPILLHEYLEKGLLPALGRKNVGPVGVFDQTETDSPVVHVVIPHANLDSFVSVAAGLDDDPAIRAAVPAYFKTPTKAKPAYARMDSTLLLAFPGQPKLVLPALSATKAPRIFEIRNYESFSDDRNLRKVEMFDSGEMDVQREVGLAPVFYGQALSGANLPRVVYMVCGPDRATHKAHWSAFSAHPTWKKLKADSKYADTATHNTNVFTVPTEYSQI